jgi:succinate-semialdehyde dehydrogenase/glutarate-semialdehyde dehydrogenase
MAATESTTERSVLDAVGKNLYIGGRWVDATGGGTLPVEDPATGETLCEVADAQVQDAQAALAAADEAFATFRHVAPRERADILRRAYDLITERTDDLALLMTLEMGKPVAESKGEIAYAANFFRWYAEEAVRINGRFTVNETGAGRVLTMQQPIGPCLFITPWNFPLAMGTRKIGPAIAAGCTMVVKPAKQTPLSMLALVGILEEAGLPAGVCNVVTAKSSGTIMEPLIRDPRVRKLSFTGSTEVGRKLIEQSAQGILRTSMELGGNAPFVVFEDADVDAALEGAKIAKFRNGGQACTSANRFLVHEDVAEEFTKGLVAMADEFVLGPGTEEGTTLGPLISDDAVEKVVELVTDAVDRGATVAAGGTEKSDGRYYPATVLTDVPADAKILHEEVFGPVAPIITFSSEEEAVRLANDTEYGLVAYAYTNDAARLLRVSRTIEAGMLGINTGLVSNPAAPFGGIKDSGFGREGGPEGIEEYLQPRYVAIPDPRD